jgi:hypothetical protein
MKLGHQPGFFSISACSVTTGENSRFGAIFLLEMRREIP